MTADLNNEENPYAKPEAESVVSRRDFGGWLNVLFIYLFVVQPAGAALFLFRVWAADLLAQAETVLYATNILLRAVLGIVVAVLLSRRSVRAVLVAKVYFLSMAALPFLSYAIHVTWLGAPRQQIFYPWVVLLPILWLLYLSFSRRVAETFTAPVSVAQSGGV